MFPLAEPTWTCGFERGWLCGDVGFRTRQVLGEHRDASVFLYYFERELLMNLQNYSQHRKVERVWLSSAELGMSDCQGERGLHTRSFDLGVRDCACAGPIMDAPEDDLASGVVEVVGNPTGYVALKHAPVSSSA